MTRRSLGRAAARRLRPRPKGHSGPRHAVSTGALPVREPGEAGSAEETGLDALWDRLRDAHRRLRAELRSVLRSRGLYLSEYRALRRLSEGERTMGELAELLGLTPASMTDLGRQLEAHGWVRRRRSTRDRRAILVEATASGQRVSRTAHIEYRRRLRRLGSRLTPADRRGLERGLDALLEVLNLETRPSRET